MRIHLLHNEEIMPVMVFYDFNTCNNLVILDFMSPFGTGNGVVTLYYDFTLRNWYSNDGFRFQYPDLFHQVCCSLHSVALECETKYFSGQNTGNTG